VTRLFTPTFLAFAIVACGSTPASPPPTQAEVGEPCDPSLSAPCAPVAEVCTQVVCDPTDEVCTKEPYDPAACASNDGGADTQIPGDGGVGSPCTSGKDCAYPLACVNLSCLG
jgi:hypothetical protein